MDGPTAYRVRIFHVNLANRTGKTNDTIIFRIQRR